VGAMPVTGQPLPLISRGGTSTFVNCAYLGMMLAVSRNAKMVDGEETVAEEPEIIDENIIEDNNEDNH
ncbi:MAG: FtsW/RodA/SpoVE family cell cycle protein, partial [Bacteroidaceae bacterium]|nr:FtsW/RodA/SpoVE family cell cycle protein [Bacteroidaceae bacterium]